MHAAAADSSDDDLDLELSDDSDDDDTEQQLAELLARQKGNTQRKRKAPAKRTPLRNAAKPSSYFILRVRSEIEAASATSNGMRR